MLRGENLNYKMVAMDDFGPSYLCPLTSLGLKFSQVCSIEGCFNFLESRPYLERRVTRILKPLKLKHVTLIKTMPTVKEASDAKSVVWIS